MTGTGEPTAGTGTKPKQAPTRQPPTMAMPTLLTAGDIEMELRRLVRHLIAGTRLLYRTDPGPNGLADGELLLDLEVDGIRCQLTRLAAPDHRTEVRLTPREREVARMVAMGLTNATIAGKLNVSPWTVSTHLRRIFAKLDVTTRAAMVAVITTADTQRAAAAAQRAAAT